MKRKRNFCAGQSDSTNRKVRINLPVIGFEMLQITKEDWATEGEAVDSIVREIKRLEAMIQK